VIKDLKINIAFSLKQRKTFYLSITRPILADTTRLGIAWSYKFYLLTYLPRSWPILADKTRLGIASSYKFHLLTYLLSYLLTYLGLDAYSVTWQAYNARPILGHTKSQQKKTMEAHNTEFHCCRVAKWHYCQLTNHLWVLTMPQCLTYLLVYIARTTVLRHVRVQTDVRPLLHQEPPKHTARPRDEEERDGRQIAALQVSLCPMSKKNNYLMNALEWDLMT